MANLFADLYIDKLFTERDMLGLYQVIIAVEQDRVLPEEFWLFCRLLEWAGSTRSGSWQYYERLSGELFGRMSRVLDGFGLAEIAEKYRSGRDLWNKPDGADSLDEWVDAHQQQIESAAFDLILRCKDFLKARQ